MSNAHGEFAIVEVNKFEPGNEITTFKVKGIKCGLAICYDAFFDEFIKIYGREGELRLSHILAIKSSLLVFIS